MLNDKQIYIFGTGQYQQFVETHLSGLHISGYLDNAAQKQGGLHNGKPILNPNVVKHWNFDTTAILIASSYYHDIAEQLQKLGLILNTHFFDAVDFIPLNSRRKILGIDEDMEEEFINIYLHCRKYTMTSVQRMYALFKATEYIVQRDIPGDIVECGVWKGGSSMLAAASMHRLGDISRTCYLYDTYAGMSEPGHEDVDFSHNNNARGEWEKMQTGEHNLWCFSSLEDVKRHLSTISYPLDNFKLIEGKVEDTIPTVTPERISLLRLDTDWYESTYHELLHLFPLLSRDGVIIVDDYGYWKGAKKAVDEYFEQHSIKILLNKIDSTGRIGIKN